MSATHPPRPPQVDPALLRGLTQSRHSRRDLLRLMGMGAGAVGAGGLLSACGVSGQAPKAGSSPTTTKGVADAAAAYWKDKKQTGQVNWANWPLYIDTAGKGNHPSINQFQKQTGIQVKYSEVIQDNPSFFATVRPTLEAGQYTGYDTAVISDGIVLTELMTLDYLVPLDQSRLTNFKKNAGAKNRNPQYDPGNRYSIPWQAGFTGLAYDPEKTGREITSFQDLLDPKFKGKIGMFGDAGELANAAMFALGINAEKSTVDDWKKAADHLKKQKSSGVLRNYYDQSYVDALGRGEVWLTQAWSGDIFQKNLSDGTNFKFIIPSEGGTIWTDNMAIPVTAKNPVDALTLMDYFYQVPVSATLAEYINYVCPVPAAKAQILKDAAKLSGADKTAMEGIAKSPLVFPAAADYAKLHYYVSFDTPAEQQQYQKTFEPIVLG